MNSRSVLRVSYNVRASLTFHMSCLVFVLLSLLCIYYFSPLFYCPVVSTSAADAPVIDYFVDDRTSTVELLGKQSHSFPQISPTFPYFLALGIVTAAATVTILQLQQVRINADALGNLQRRDSAESLRV